MPRIAGVNIPENKQILIALTHIYGIGLSLSKKILKQADINSMKKASDLSSEEVNKIKEVLEKRYKVEGDLRRMVMMSVKRLKDIGAWRGMRHIKGLPVRGQRTKTNNRTVRGNVRKTVGSGHRLPPGPK